MLAGVNRALDGFVRPEVPILGAPRSAFQVCGFTGWIVCCAVALALAWYTGASLWITATLLLTGSLAFLATAAITKAVTGVAGLGFYHHAIAIMAAGVGALALLDVPVLPYLDLLAVALATALCFGRVGCLMAGCCHGKPAHLGVRYRDEHVACGFPHVLVGVRLFPTQALEAALTLALAVSAGAVIASNAPPGTACVMIAVVYAAGRFLLEL